MHATSIAERWPTKTDQRRQYGHLRRAKLTPLPVGHVGDRDEARCSCPHCRERREDHRDRPTCRQNKMTVRDFAAVRVLGGAESSRPTESIDWRWWGTKTRARPTRCQTAPPWERSVKNRSTEFA